MRPSRQCTSVDVPFAQQGPKSNGTRRGEYRQPRHGFERMTGRFRPMMGVRGAPRTLERTDQIPGESASRITPRPVASSSWFDSRMGSRYDSGPGIVVTSQVSNSAKTLVNQTATLGGRVVKPSRQGISHVTTRRIDYSIAPRCPSTRAPPQNLERWRHDDDSSAMRKTPTVRWGSFKKSRRRPTLPGGDPQVPSALVGLTAVFGMGTGISPPP